MISVEIKNGNNMPVQSPLVPDPVLPYHCKNSKTVFAICKIESKTLLEHLKPTPFEYVNDLCMIYVTDFLESPELPYMDAGIIFTVKYKNQYGGYYMYEWEDNDVAIEAGRYWGYPKKYAEISLKKEENFVRGTVIRKNVKLIDIVLNLNKPIDSVPKLHTVFPHLNILTIPKPDGPGIFSQRITSRDNSSTCKTLSNQLAEVNVKLNSSINDPIGDFEPLTVLGGGYSVTDFLATTENGWAKVIDTII